MGSLAKRIGQLNTKSLESESSKILRTIQSNKIKHSLSQRLDETLKDSHDMKVFGLGTLSSMSSRDRYVRFTHAMYGIYSTMENELDLCCYNSSSDSISDSSSDSGSSNSSKAVEHFWTQHGHILRRNQKLKQDLINALGQQQDSSGTDANIQNSIESMEYSPATLKYMETIKEAGRSDRNDNHDNNDESSGNTSTNSSGRLLGHAYTRYLADLMGGSVLAKPTELALGLDNIQQYAFEFGAATNSTSDGNNNPNDNMSRKEYVEMIYKDLNISGNILIEQSEEGLDTDNTSTSTKTSTETSTSTNNNTSSNSIVLEEIVNEARIAFHHNIEVYSEEPIYMDSIIGLKNIVSGWAFQKR